MVNFLCAQYSFDTVLKAEIDIKIFQSVYVAKARAFDWIANWPSIIDTPTMFWTYQ